MCVRETGWGVTGGIVMIQAVLPMEFIVHVRRLKVLYLTEQKHEMHKYSHKHDYLNNTLLHLLSQQSKVKLTLKHNTPALTVSLARARAHTHTHVDCMCVN